VVVVVVVVVVSVLVVVELVVVLLVVVVEVLVLVVLVVATVLLVVELLDVVVELLVDDDEVEVEVVLVVATVLLVVELVDVLVVVGGTVVVVVHPGMGACWQPLAGSHVVVVQTFPSSQLTAVPPHGPAVHPSAVVQALASLPGVPSVTTVCAQPVAGLQVSVVQGLPSSQVRVPTHCPPVHASPVVQAFASLQGVPLVTAVWTQPLSGSQLSVVQALASSQLTALPTHWSATQVSPVVQALPSSQAVPSGWSVWTQTPA